VLASYYVGRNFIYLIAKALPGRTILRNLPRIVVAQVRIALQALRGIRHPSSRARLRGMAAGLLTWPRVLPARRRIMRSARLTPRRFERVLRRFGGKA
jgi:hypothetical protein